MKKLILSGVVASILSTSMYAESVTKDYFGIKTGSFSYDESFVAAEEYDSLNGYSNYKTHDKMTTTGINFGRLVQKENGFVYGSNADVYSISEGMFGIGVELRLGYAPKEQLAIYGTLGYSLNALTDYVGTDGTNYGIGMTYDINERFGAYVDYKVHNLTISDDNNNDLFDRKATGLAFGIGIKY
jgi:predicted porin